MAEYNLYPSVDENFNFPPPVRKAFVESPEVASMIVSEVAYRSGGKITGQGVLRILASKDADTPLTDGDLLLVLPTPRFFTDFNEYGTGSIPDDWTPRWGTTSWTVVDDSSATGGKVLRHESLLDSRRLMTWNKAATAERQYKDAEIVSRWRSSTHDGAMRAALRASGTLGAETGYYYSYSPSSSTARLGLYVNGEQLMANNADSAPIPFVANTWYMTRARVEGNSRMMKIWRSGTTEPVEWSVVSTAEKTLTNAGWLGLFVFGRGVTDIDYVGMAFDGGRAPTKAV